MLTWSNGIASSRAIDDGGSDRHRCGAKNESALLAQGIGVIPLAMRVSRQCPAYLPFALSACAQRATRVNP
jgi:hypothetical protein